VESSGAARAQTSHDHANDETAWPVTARTEYATEADVGQRAEHSGGVAVRQGAHTVMLGWSAGTTVAAEYPCLINCAILIQSIQFEWGGTRVSPLRLTVFQMVFCASLGIVALLDQSLMVNAFRRGAYRSRRRCSTP